MDQGWVKLHRRIFESDWATDYKTNYLFIYCLSMANHDDGNWRGIEIRRSQFVTSHNKLAQATGLSIQNVRTAIKKLKSTGNLTIKATNKYQVITITNYDKYQDANTQPNNQLTFNQQSTNIQLTTNNNKKNKKNKKNEKNLKEKTKAKKKVSLDELSVDHISDWLANKRSQGIYLYHDEYQILETFKDYCLSKGKKYADYVAAFRNAFRWEQNQPKTNSTDDMLTIYAQAALE